MKNLVLGIALLVTPNVAAMDSEVVATQALLPLERPQDAILWVDALVQSPGHLLKDTAVECFTTLTEEYLPLYDTVKIGTIEDKVALLNQERTSLLDQARRKLMIAWAHHLLESQKPENTQAAEEKKSFQEDLAECINLMGQILTIDDLRIHFVHSAQVACFDDIEHNKATTQAIDEELQHRATEDQRWQGKNNLLNTAFEAPPKFTRSIGAPQLQEEPAAIADETLVKRQVLYEQVLQFFQASQQLDASNAQEHQQEEQQEAAEIADTSLASQHLQGMVLRQAFGLPNSEEHGYRLCVAVQHVGTARLRASLEQKRAKAQEKIEELGALHAVFEQKHAELLTAKQDILVLRARLRRRGNFDLTEKDQALLVAFDPKPSGGCIVS